MDESNEMTRLMDSLGRNQNTPAEIYANIRNKALEEAAELMEENGEEGWAYNIRSLKTESA